MSDEKGKELNRGYSLCFNTSAKDKRIKNELGLLQIISSLSAAKGYCFASNEYLAEEFDIHIDTVSRRISKLKKYGYLNVEYTRRGAEIISRKITLMRLSSSERQKCLSDERLKRLLTNDENAGDNITIKDNNTSINKNNKHMLLFDIIFSHYLSKPNLTKHKKKTKPMREALKRAINWLKLTEDECKILIDRFSIVCELTKDTEYPVKVRNFDEFFGQKLFKGTNLICSEYQDNGAKWKRYGDPNWKAENSNEKQDIEQRGGYDMYIEYNSDGNEIGIDF